MQISLALWPQLSHKMTNKLYDEQAINSLPLICCQSVVLQWIQYSTILYCSVVYTILYCSVMFCSVCTVLYCTIELPGIIFSKLALQVIEIFIISLRQGITQDCYAFRAEMNLATHPKKTLIYQ